VIDKNEGVLVRYRNVDGYYVFTSDDVDGVYIASKDVSKAVRQIEPSIKKAIELNGEDTEIDWHNGAIEELVGALETAHEVCMCGACVDAPAWIAEILAKYTKEQTND